MSSRHCVPAVRILLALVACVVTLLPRPAGAEPASAPLLAGMPVTDGSVHTAVQVGNTLYIGGEFRYVGVSSGRFVLTSDTSGTTIAMPERLDGDARVILPDGAGGWYIGGANLTIGPVLIRELVHVLSDGSVDPAFTGSQTNAPVRALFLHGGMLYVAGQFTTINGEARVGLAVLDATTGALQPFNAGLNGAVRALEATATTLYLGGAFTDVNGTPRAGLAALDLGTQTLTSWNPGVTGTVDALQLATTTMYVGGTFTAAGGAVRQNLAALNILADTNNATSWDPQANGPALSFALVGNTLVVGGQFILVNGTNRFHLAAYDTATGALSSWAPNPNGFVHALEPSATGTSVHIGGAFTQINGVGQAFTAQVDMVTGNLLPWNPAPTGTVFDIARQGTQAAIAGVFSGVGAVKRGGLAAIDLSTHLPTTWTADVAGGDVRAMTYWNNVIYIGGTFLQVNGVNRMRLAGVHLNGSLEPFDPGADGQVNALAATQDRIFVGGAFAAAGGVPAANLGAVQPGTGAPVSPSIGASGEVHVFKLFAGRLYVGGEFDTLAGAPRANVGALFSSDATLDPWAAATDGPVHAIDVGVEGASEDYTRVYIGGNFSQINGMPRPYFGAVSVVDAAFDPSFDAAVNGPVHAVKAVYHSVFIGGQFDSVDGKSHFGAATVNSATGAKRIWSPFFATSSTAHPTSFVPTSSGVWAVGTYRFANAQLLPGLAFYPDEIPTLAPILNLGLPENTAAANVVLTATDEVLPDEMFQFRAVVSNPNVIDPASLDFVFSGGQWRLHFSPKPDASGTTQIAVRMDDGLLLALQQFTVEVTSVNDQPVINGLSDATIVKDTVFTRAFTVTDVDSSPNTINLSVGSSNPALVPVANVVSSGGAEDKILTVTPLAGQTGSAIISVTVNDGVSGNVTASFTLTVVGGSTPPTITAIANQTTTVGVPVGPLSFMVADVDGGSLTVTASSNNATLVPQAGIVLGGSESNRTVTVTPAAGQAGVAMITLNVDDGISTASTSFQLTVTGLPPGPPQTLQATTNNTQATFTWQPPTTGGPPSTYVLEGGTSPGGSDLPTTPVGLVTSYAVTLPPGTYYIRVRAANDFGLSAPSSEITIVIGNGLPSVPGAPSGLISGVSPAFVTLFWVAPTTGGAPTHYVLEAGSAWGKSDLAVMPTKTAATGVQIPGVGKGVYYVRIRAANAQGVGPASNEAVITVGAVQACNAPPVTPVALTPTVQGRLVTLSWAPGNGNAPTGYRVLVGSASGQVNIADISINSALTSLMAVAPPGTYYVRLVAVNKCGTSAPSNEVSLTVGGAPAPPGPVTGLTWSLGPNNTVTLQWQAAAGNVSSYLLVAGNKPGASNLAVVPTGSTSTSLTVPRVGSGTYYVRVYASNGGGHGAASNEVVVKVP